MTTQHRRFRYDYMEVYVPDDPELSHEERCDIAIAEARERVRIWQVPCLWEAELSKTDPNIIIVRRKRAKIINVTE